MVLLILLSIVGAYAAACWLLENLIIPLAAIVWSLLKLSISRKKSLSDRYGKWAVITGATDGIGKGYAQHLAAKGMDLVLISRSQEKLIKVSREIQKSTGVNIKLIVADFSIGDSIYKNIRKELEGIDIGILVNNVGTGTEPLGLFETHADKFHLQIVNVNILSVLMMTHIVLPKMKKAQRGIIINVSSQTAVIPAPYVSSYTGSKSFGFSFTLALQHELRGSGVECQLVVPGFVRTNLVHTLPLTIFGGKLIPDGYQFGACATWLVGKTDFTAGHWYHEVLNFFINLLPFFVQRKVAAVIWTSFMNDQESKKRTSL
ncbi:inactive hydroxysteroid dehydrogenase-like protein 1 [Armigeres subalbatus]|uniref:inactive hydroxysteroid dehydrogenase-like protein 1 n=1 Tax=Armigeres subalbatus TaxID=124917 RepID=UPI002ED1F76C